MGDEAMARCAASGESKMATMGRLDPEESFVTSYWERLVLVPWLRGAELTHLEVSEGVHVAEFLERG